MNWKMSAVTDPPRFGLIAGWGRYPILVAQALQRHGYRVYCLGITGHADRVLAEVCDHYQEEGLARLGAHLRYFRCHGVRHATMAGKIHKSLIFQPGFLLTHRPDWRCVRTFYPHFVLSKQDRKDDTLLMAMVNAYAEQGIHLAPATDFAPELLVAAGRVSGPRLSRAQQKDIQFGWQLAKEMGRLDVGQTVAVKGRAVLAVEAVEGTDECIRRAGALCRQNGFTVVKVAKPQQDMRFDVPTIGVGTLNTMAEAGARVLAVEAEKTILLDQRQVVDFARRHQITIVAVSDPGEARRAVAA
jgi:DUF1009 family protein